MDAEIHRIADLIPVLRGKTLDIEPLSGGLTNRNYRVAAGEAVYVLRIAGADTALLGIDRAREVACQQAAAAAGVSPRVVAFLPEREALVIEFCPGRTLTVEDCHVPALLERIGRVLRRCHEQPPPEGLGTFSAFRTVRNYHRHAQERKVSLPAELGPALERLAAVERALATGAPPCLCHNDLLAANFVDDGAALRLIDWEYGGLGDRFFDLGNLAVNLQLNDDEERALLTAYFGAAQSDDLRRLRLMRLASDMREAMWGFLQAGVSTLHPAEHYLAYGGRHLRRFNDAVDAAA